MKKIRERTVEGGREDRSSGVWKFAAIHQNLMGAHVLGPCVVVIFSQALVNVENRCGPSREFGRCGVSSQKTVVTAVYGMQTEFFDVGHNVWAHHRISRPFSTGKFLRNIINMTYNTGSHIRPNSKIAWPSRPIDNKASEDGNPTRGRYNTYYNTAPRTSSIVTSSPFC